MVNGVQSKLDADDNNGIKCREIWGERPRRTGTMTPRDTGTSQQPNRLFIISPLSRTRKYCFPSSNVCLYHTVSDDEDNTEESSQLERHRRKKKKKSYECSRYPSNDKLIK